jgi:alanine racemase
MSISRRSFLQSGAALPALGIRAQPDAPPKVQYSSFDPWVEVHVGHLRANAAAVHKLAGVPILAVIKNNGYGTGVLNVARALESSDAIRGFAVVKLNEAIALRDGGVRKPVVLMGPVDERDLAEVARRDVTLMVYTPIAEALGRAAAQTGRPFAVQVCVDTGLGREGVPHRSALDIIRGLAGNRSVRIDGIMTTFTEDADFDREQLRRFRELTTRLEEERIPCGARHAASTYTLFQHRDAFLDMVRPGMALYGIYPEPAFRKPGALVLTPAVALKARVAYVKQLQSGDSAGYNRAYVADRPIWIATLPVGHADGLPRVAAKGGQVRISGSLYPIIASVSASHTIVAIGPDRRVEIGDEATMFDWTDGSRPEDLAAACGASVYDLTMHLNPALPRKIL